MHRRVIIFAIAALTPATDVAAQVSRESQTKTTIEYDTVGNWTISADQTLNFGCYASVSYKDGTELRIGWIPAAEKLYVTVAAPSWRRIEIEKEYELKAKFGKKQGWEITATGLGFSNGRRALFFEATNSEFVEEFRTQSNFEISYNGSVIADLDLDGSSKAFEKIVQCQKTVSSVLNENEPDPFSADTYYSNDPFE